ncbi:hypothetical protein KIL84_004170, partial [Mauremys mutica]
GSQPHPDLLVCSVTGFYLSGIEMKRFENRQEQTAGVVFTELLHNRDCTFQIRLMLAMTPRRRDVYTCRVEHVSLRGPPHCAPHLPPPLQKLQPCKMLNFLFLTTTLGFPVPRPSFAAR